MFKNLMSMPFFHGVSMQKFSEILGKYRFHFIKFADKDRIISVGDPCTHLSVIISGKVRITVSSADNKVKISQTLGSPEPIYPDFFFGKSTHYPADVYAEGDCGIMQIEKRDYINIINSDNIFLFNFLNLLSMNAQLSTDGVIALTSGDLKKRIAYWIVALTQTNSTDIVMECRQRDLYAVFGVPRQSLVAALTEMKENGLLDFSTDRIEIRDRKSLSALLES